ncbi:hypothetical protein D3C71_1189240 [compost metagenome]
MAQQSVALYHLSATRVPGDDDLLHIRKLLTVTQPRDDFVQCLVGTQTKRRGGFAAGHPLVALPAQNGVGYRVQRDVGFIEELRGDHQGRIALPGQLRCLLAAVEIGLRIA